MSEVPAPETPEEAVFYLNVSFPSPYDMPPMTAEERARDVFTVLARHAAKDALATAAACDTFLGLLRRRLPASQLAAAAPTWSGAREDMDDWAVYAADWQIAAMLVACLDRIGKGRHALDDRKALMAAIWKGLPDKDKRAFLARVDPKGVARHAAA